MIRGILRAAAGQSSRHMTRTKIFLLTAPLAAGGLALALHATFRVNGLERELHSAATAGQAAGASFVETLRGEHAERQRLAFDRRRDVALRLAAARRDRLLGLLGVAAAGLAGSALSVMSRISVEVEEDRRHVGSAAREAGPKRS
jgi:hypothetical protein